MTVAPLRPAPPLDRDARAGLVGEFDDALAPYTESSSAARALHLLLGCGCLFGRGPFVQTGTVRHHAGTWAQFVGPTAARKGTARGDVHRFILSPADPEFEPRVTYGIGSGEGMIATIADRVTGRDRHGKEVVLQEGTTDKRRLFSVSEAGQLWNVCARQGSTLGDILRAAADWPPRLEIKTKHAPVCATEPHIIVTADTTPGELTKLAQGGEAILSGLLNRFVICYTTREKFLPCADPPDEQALEGPLADLRKSIYAAQSRGRVAMSDGARDAWRAVYPELSSPGIDLRGALLARGESHVLRLALIYALLDRAARIEVEHLRSALAVWEYAVASVDLIFGDSLRSRPPASAEDLKTRVHAAIAAQGSGASSAALTRELREPAATIREALAALEAEGAIRSETRQTGGRPATVYSATSTPPELLGASVRSIFARFDAPAPSDGEADAWAALFRGDERAFLDTLQELGPKGALRKGAAYVYAALQRKAAEQFDDPLADLLETAS